MEIASEVVLSGAAIALLINVVSSGLKDFVYPRFGKMGVQATVFVAALIGATYFLYKDFVPGLEGYIVAALTLFSTAVTIYEILLSRLTVFKVKTEAVEAARSK